MRAFLRLCMDRHCSCDVLYHMIQVNERKAIERTPAVESFSRISTPSIRVRGKISSLANKWDDVGPDKLGKVNGRTVETTFRELKHLVITGGPGRWSEKIIPHTRQPLSAKS